MPNANISIIIAARNNGKYLREAIDSALGQTVPCEVIYADDGSYDDSNEIADYYRLCGLITCPGPQLGAVAARNRAVAHSTGRFLIHLDGDDKLPTNFTERHIVAMYRAMPDCPFVYGPAQAFGAHSQLWNVPAWKDYDLWKQNTVNTSCMMRREVFLGCGAWQDPPHSMWDFDLAIRASRFGTPQASDATLLYRQHGDSWSSQTHERIDSHRQFIARDVRIKNARISIGSILSGRLPDLFPRWISQVASAARLIRSPQSIQLVLLDNSNNPAYRKIIDAELKRYPIFHVAIVNSLSEKPDVGKTETDRRNGVARFMADACNQLQSTMTGDIRWIIEDDVLVPIDGGRSLLEHLTLGILDLPNAVSGCYRNRHVPTQYVGGHFLKPPMVNKELAVIKSIEPFPVDYAGTGCLMYWAARCPTVWESHYDKTPAHDWNWSFQLKQRRGILHMVPSVRCGHAVNADVILGA